VVLANFSQELTRKLMVGMTTQVLVEFARQVLIDGHGFGDEAHSPGLSKCGAEEIPGQPMIRKKGKNIDQSPVFRFRLKAPNRVCFQSEALTRSKRVLSCPSIVIFKRKI
jgi:hypothetical protein